MRPIPLNHSQLCALRTEIEEERERKQIQFKTNAKNRVDPMRRAIAQFSKTGGQVGASAEKQPVPV